VDPTAVNLMTTLVPNTAGLPGPDGIVSDGAGNLFIASRGNSHIYQYNLTTNTLTQRTLVNGLDDLAPASGLGAPAAPEPSTLAGAALGALMSAGYVWRKRRRGTVAAA